MEYTHYKISCAVTDNGSNIINAVTKLFGKNKHLPCFAHTLNLVATKILEEQKVKGIVQMVKNIITFLKHSVTATDELKKIQLIDDSEYYKLVNSVPTRWNSCFYMLERFIKLSEADLLKFPKSPSMLSASQIEIIKEMIAVLQPIENVTKGVRAEHFVTCSKIIPLTNCLNLWSLILTLRLV